MTDFVYQNKSLKVRVATRDERGVIQGITNDAFMADAFFKKPEYHQRFTASDIEELLAIENSLFLVAVDESIVEEGNPSSVCGSLYLQWETKTTVDGKSQDIHGKFSAVSVPSKYGKRGIGKSLVKGTEEYLKTMASRIQSDGGIIHEIHLEMGVINLRKDLFPWYESQGFHIVSEIRPNDAEITRIILEDLDVCCILMSKLVAFP